MTIRTRVEIILRNRLGKILLGRSGRFDKYVFPGGGVDENESLIEAAKRELQEETGRNVTGLKQLNKQPFKLFNAQRGPSNTFYFTGNVAGGKRSKNFGADNDIFRNISFVDPDKAHKILQKQIVSGDKYEHAEKFRDKMLQRATKVKAASVGVIMPTLLNDLNFLRGFEDKCQEWGIKEKAEVDNFLKTAALTMDLTRPLHEIEKEAGVNPYATMLGAGLGMGAGGLIGYVGTEDEEKKMQNAMLGALVGAPIGGYAGASLAQSGATEKAYLAKEKQIKKVREDPERAAHFSKLEKDRAARLVAGERKEMLKDFESNPLNASWYTDNTGKYYPGRVKNTGRTMWNWLKGVPGDVGL